MLHRRLSDDSDRPRRKGRPRRFVARREPVTPAFPLPARRSTCAAMSDAAKPFSDKLALVTGASRGIGAAAAEALAAAGAHVVLVARTASALEEVEERIHAAGGTATIAPLDLTDGESIGKLAVAIG